MSQTFTKDMLAQVFRQWEADAAAGKWKRPKKPDPQALAQSFIDAMGKALPNVRVTFQSTSKGEA